MGGTEIKGSGSGGGRQRDKRGLPTRSPPPGIGQHPEQAVFVPPCVPGIRQPVLWLTAISDGKSWEEHPGPTVVP